MELKQKVIRAAFWVGLVNSLTKVLSILTTLILADLLLPNDFGLIAIATLLTGFTGIFMELGFSSAIIAKRGDWEDAANAAFLMNIIWNTLLFFLLFLSAPFIAVFFREEALTAIIRVLSISLIIKSFGFIPSAIIEKEMAFKKRVIPEFLNILFYTIFSITLAYMGYGYWSIVAGHIGGAISGTVSIWIVSRWRPYLSFKKEALEEVWNFGKFIVGSNIVNFTTRNIDDFFVGRILGATQLGFYNFAYRIANIPATNITNVIGRIMFPAYSQISEHIFDLRNAFNRTFYFTAMLTIPLSMMIIAFTPDFLHLFYGDKWNMAILPIQIMAISGLIRSLGSGMGGVFLATKKPEIMLKVTTIELVIFSALLYPTITRYGITGVCLLRILVIVYSFSHNYSNLSALIKTRFIDLIGPTITFLIISILSLLFSLVVVNSLGIHDSALNFFTKVSIFVFANISATLTTKQARLFCSNLFNPHNS